MRRTSRSWFRDERDGVQESDTGSASLFSVNRVPGGGQDDTAAVLDVARHLLRFRIRGLQTQDGILHFHRLSIISQCKVGLAVEELPIPNLTQAEGQVSLRREILIRAPDDSLAQLQTFLINRQRTAVRGARSESIVKKIASLFIGACQLALQLQIVARFRRKALQILLRLG